MGRRTVASAAEQNKNWVAGMGRAGAKYAAGIQRYQGNPMAEAANAADTYAAKTAEAVSSGRYAAALNRVPVDRWRSQAMQFGASALAASAAKASAKQLEKAQKLQSVQQAASDAARSLPKGDAIGRFTAAYNIMKAAKGTI